MNFLILFLLSIFFLLITIFQVSCHPLIEMETRITFGNNASSGQFPFHALLYISRTSGTIQCGGNLIHPNFVLSAKHCFNDVTFIEIRLGAIHRDKPQQIRSGVFLWGRTDTDLAIVKLNRPVDLNNFVNLISLPPSTPDLQNYQIKAIGFGMTEHGTLPDNLQYIPMRIMSNAECRKFYGNIGTNIVCAIGLEKSPQNTCSGDSGSPLMAIHNENNFVMLIGINSFGSAAGCTTGSPTGFVNIMYYLDWILGIIQSEN